MLNKKKLPLIKLLLQIQIPIQIHLIPMFKIPELSLKIKKYSQQHKVRKRIKIMAAVVDINYCFFLC
jgi:hypothetical protein